MATSVAGNNVLFLSREARSAVKIKGVAASRPILDEQRFAHLVRVEEKRTNRSGDPFMIALVSIGDLGNRVGMNWDNVVQVLRATTREIDTLGWHQQGSVLGILFTEVGSAEQQAVEAISKRLARSLRESLDFSASAEIFVSFHVCRPVLTPASSLACCFPEPARVVHLTSPQREFADVSKACCDNN
jgi:hypothetical protein